jgi:rhodanese-related sulfurtransferase
MARLMSSTELASRLERDRDNVILSDVRNPEEYQREHIPGAINIPLEKLADQARKFKKSQRIIVYGETHSDEASNQAAELLEGMGFRKVSDFDGGVHAWKQAGYLTTEDGATN